MKNPVKHQKWAYKKLNDLRIRNLLNKRGSTERQPFDIGQFVTIMETQPPGDNPNKLNIPAHSQLFKIRSIHKEGFSLSLVNVSTGAIQEVLSSNIKPLCLESLEQMTYSTPDLFRRLVKIRNSLERNI